MQLDRRLLFSFELLAILERRLLIMPYGHGSACRTQFMLVIVRRAGKLMGQRLLLFGLMRLP